MNRRKFIKNFNFFFILGCFHPQSIKKILKSQTKIIKNNCYEITKVYEWFDIKKQRTLFSIHCNCIGDKKIDTLCILETRSDLNKMRPMIGDYIEIKKGYGNSATMIPSFPCYTFNCNLITKNSYYKERHKFIIM